MLVIRRHLRNIRNWPRSFSAMKTEKRPPGGVSDMEVLKDLRSLLSSNKIPSPEPCHQDKEDATQYRELVREQQKEIEQLKEEKADLRKLGSGIAAAASQGKDEEIVSLEERKLAEALAEAEAVLRLKTEDILRRMAQAVESMGSIDMGTELRKTASSLERAECFAYFLEVFLREE
jgi:hypothetical protein